MPRAEARAARPEEVSAEPRVAHSFPLSSFQLRGPCGASALTFGSILILIFILKLGYF